jgi:hypothetical protein
LGDDESRQRVLEAINNLKSKLKGRILRVGRPISAQAPNFVHHC